MIFFLISIILVFSSSYFVASILQDKKVGINITYFVLILISQVILTFELLSIIGQVNTYGVLVVNSFALLTSSLIWIRQGKPVLNLKLPEHSVSEVLAEIKRDKIFIFLIIFFVFSSLIGLFLALITPLHTDMSMIQHLSRIAFWIQNSSLAHHDLSSPINSDILILWSMIFLKGDYLAQVPAYLAYIGVLFILWNYITYFNYSPRRKLWAVLLLASLPALIIESTSIQTNIILGFFLFCSLYLYVYGIIEEDKKSLGFSTIAFAIAIGIKTTIILFLPIFATIYLSIAIKEWRRNWHMPVIFYLSVLVPVTILLGSYGYFLNLHAYGNLLGNPALHPTQSAGLYYIFANLIRYYFIFFDFTGMGKAVLDMIFFQNLEGFLLHIIGFHYTLNNGFPEINSSIQQGSSSLGPLGIIFLLPCIYNHGLFGLFSKKGSKFHISMAYFILIGFFVSISLILGFLPTAKSYFITAVVLGSPILIYNYSRKLDILKLATVLVMIFNFMIISTFNDSKPMMSVIYSIKQSGIMSVRDTFRINGGY